MDTNAEHAILGNKAVWKGVGYSGDPYAPADGTYQGVDAASLAWTSIADTGRHPRSGSELGNLRPLIAAALYDAAFAAEAGPLQTWNN